MLLFSEILSSDPEGKKEIAREKVVHQYFFHGDDQDFLWYSQYLSR
jgi:hypothetical protein